MSLSSYEYWKLNPRGKLACPTCGGDLDVTDEHLACTNPSCKSRLKDCSTRYDILMDES